MKTIRQIADEIGVSKTAVNKQIANLGLRSGLRKNGNQFAIDEHQEALIKEAFSEKSQTEIENQTQTENHEVSDLVCVLQATIDTLQGQLEVKDRQIEKLTEALVAAQQTAAAAQALHAGTIQHCASVLHRRSRRSGKSGVSSPPGPAGRSALRGTAPHCGQSRS